MSLTLIAGKDAPAESTIDRASDLLELTGLEVVASSWLNPAPQCWSVHLQSRTCPRLYTNGKGTSRQACLASALGEFHERLATNFFFADYYLDEGGEDDFLFYPEERWFTVEEVRRQRRRKHPELLTAELWQFYDPERQLPASAFYEHNSRASVRGLAALPFDNLSTGKKLYLPISLLNNLYVSNGMAAGNSEPECCAQALSEIFERHVKQQIIALGICPPDIPEKVLQGMPRAWGIACALRAAGFHLQVKDCSLGGRFPVVGAILADPASGGVYAAFGANCRLEVAVERTLTEMLQGRELKQLHNFPPPVHELAKVADPFNLESHFIDSDGLLSWNILGSRPDFTFHPWDFSGSTAQEFARLQQLVENHGYQLLRTDYRHFGLYVCRLVVPGMSEIYPTEDLLLANRLEGARLREMLLDLPKAEEKALRRLWNRLDDCALHDTSLVAEAIGVTFTPESAWSGLTVGELRAMLALAAGDMREALIWSEWCSEQEQLTPSRLRLYRLLAQLLGLRLAHGDTAAFEPALELFYRREELAMAKAIIAGEIRFYGLNFAPNWSAISPVHHQLLATYHHLRRMRQTAGN